MWYVNFFCNLPMSLSPSLGSVQRHPRLEDVCLRREMRSYSNLHIRTKVRFLPLLFFYGWCDYQSVPILIVFTQYDRLVRTKEAELRQRYPDMDAASLRDRSVVEAKGSFGYCLKLLKRSMERLGIPMPRYATASGRFAPL